MSQITPQSSPEDCPAAGKGVAYTPDQVTTIVRKAAAFRARQEKEERAEELRRPPAVRRRIHPARILIKAA